MNSIKKIVRNIPISKNGRRISRLRLSIQTVIAFILFCSISFVAQTQVQKQLYLTEPGQGLDRVHPGLVSPIDNTTATSNDLGFIGGGDAGSFGTPNDISLQFGGQDALTPDLAVYESGGVETLHTVFLGKDADNLIEDKLNIYYSYKTGAGAWSAPILISTDLFNQDAKEFPSIAVHASNVAHIVYAHKDADGVGTDDSKINIYYVTVTGGSTVSTPVRISDDTFGNDALTPEIAIDENGDAHVVYVSKNSTDAKLNIYYVNNIGGTWSSPVSVSDDGFNQDVGLNPSIAVDSNGEVHVVYAHKDGAIDAKVNIYYASNSGGSWSSPERISDDTWNQDAQINPSIVIDENDAPHVVYAHKDGVDSGDGIVDAKINIYYTNKTSGSWSTPVDLSNDVDGQDSANPSIGISSTGIVRIAFSNNGDNIYYTENSGAGNTWTTLLDINTSPASSSDGNYPAIAITGNNVHVVYQDKHNTLSGKIDVWHTSAPLANFPSSAIFTQTDTLCGDLILTTGQTITITAYTKVSNGTMPASPAITATLKDNLDNQIIELTNPTYTAGAGSAGTLVWMGTLGAETTVAAGGTIILNISTSMDVVTFQIEYDSDSKPSQVEFSTSTFINIESLDVYDGAYPFGNIVTKAVQGNNLYVRVEVSDPFGSSDINGANITITPTGTTVPAMMVNDDGCTKIYEYTWTPPAADQIFDVQATAKEGYEGTVTSVDNTSFEVCTNCPPSAVDDNATIDQGESIKLNVLANDSDPNGNIDITSLTIISAPDNGGTALPQADGTIIYFPNGSFLGIEQFIYEVCDLSTPTPLCSQATVTISVIENFVDVCSEANRNHTYYLPFPAANLYDAFPDAVSCPENLGSNLRTIIAIKSPYPGTVIVYDHWEDDYESEPNNPIQLTTETWGDGNLNNGVAPGYPTDILPAGASIVIDGIFNYSTRTNGTIEFDGRDKITTSSDISLSKISGDTNAFTVQSAKTDVYDINRFGTSFVVPFGEDLGDEFQYTSLFIRSGTDGTEVTVDVNADGVLDGNDVIDAVLDEGEVLFIEGNPNLVNQINDVRAGASVTATAPVGLDILFGGLDCYGTRNINILPGAFYSNVYYTPVPTTASSDPNAVFIYNSTASAMSIGVYNNAGLVTTLNVSSKTTLQYELPFSTTSGYKFENASGESFTIIEVMDSPNASNSGSTFDWAISLIAENRLTDFTSIAWAPGSDDLTTNTGPLWVTAATPANGPTTTLYVKYDGDIISGVPNESPCGLTYDYSVTLGELDLHQVLDSDGDQSGVALYTCDGTVFAAVYGEDAATASVASPSLDVGTLLQPMCRENKIFAVDDFEVTPPNTPVLVGILDNDFGFLANVDPTSVSTLGLLAPANGTISVNPDGTILYTPNNGFLGLDYFEYQVCAIENPNLCDIALVTILITDCNANVNNALLNGFVYLEQTPDNGAYDAETFVKYRRVDLYADGGTIGVIDGSDAIIQTTVANVGGAYTFAVTSTGNYIVKVNVSDGEYDAAILDEQSANIAALNTCVNDLYLGVRPVLVANNDASAGGVDQPQVINVLDNDMGVPDPSTVTNIAWLPPSNGSVTINPDGTITYTPNPGFIGTDVFEYEVCSLEDPGLCDAAVVIVTVSCDFSPGENNIFGTVFYDADLGADFDAGEGRAAGVTVNLYEDSDNNGVPDGAAIQTTTTDPDGGFDFSLNLLYETFGFYDQKILASTDDAAQKLDGTMKALNETEVKLSKKSDPNWVGLRFTNVTIPANATVTSSFVYFKASADDDAATEATIIYAQDDTQNPLTFSETDFDISGRDQTESFVPWTIPLWDKDLADPYYPTPDIKSLIQEVVMDVSGLDGDELVLMFQGPVNDYEHKAFTWDDDPANAPRLVINYTVPGDDPYYFLTDIVEPAGTALTTAPYQTTFPDFAVDGVGSCGNNFGLSTPDLVTVKTLSSGDPTVNVGDAVEFAIAVKNNGAPDAFSVSLIDQMPEGITYTGYSATAGSYNPATGLWDGFNLVNGASDTLRLMGTVNEGQEGNFITNVSTAAISSQPDPSKVGDDLEETIVVNQPIDITPIIRYVPGVVTGTSPLAFQITVQELKGNATSGLMTVVIPKDDRLTFTYDPMLTIAGPYATPDNTKWTYDGSNGSFHVWTSTTPIPAFGKSKFGFMAMYDPESSNGQVTYTVTIISGSGSENNDQNNIDTELLRYFNN